MRKIVRPCCFGPAEILVLFKKIIINLIKKFVEIRLEPLSKSKTPNVYVVMRPLEIYKSITTFYR